MQHREEEKTTFPAFTDGLQYKSTNGARVNGTDGKFDTFDNVGNAEKQMPGTPAKSVQYYLCFGIILKNVIVLYVSATYIQMWTKNEKTVSIIL